jgi:branched-subunit amino acid transport protein
MKANFLNLNLRDLLKGAIVAVLTAVFATLTALLETGKLFEKSSLPLIGAAALTAFLGYLTKNLFTNSQGQILTTEKNATPEIVKPLPPVQ